MGAAVTAYSMMRILGPFDSIANLRAVVATSGSDQTAVREPRTLKYDGHSTLGHSSVQNP